MFQVGVEHDATFRNNFLRRFSKYMFSGGRCDFVARQTLAGEGGDPHEIGDGLRV